MSDVAGSLADAAEALLGQGDPTRAEGLCRQALALDSRDYKGLVLLSYILRDRGEFEDSAVLAEQAIQVRPTMVEAYFQYALNMLSIGRYEAAAKTLQKAISLRPEIPVFHLNLGLAFENAGRRDLAQRAYREAARLDPNDEKSRMAQISQLVIEERLDRARLAAEGLLQQFPTSAPAKLAMAELCMAEDGLAKAEPFIKAALAIEPDNCEALVLLGYRLSELGNFNEAEAQFRRSLQINPTQGQAYLGLTQTKKLTKSDSPLVVQMEQIRSRSILPPGEAAALRFALAKAYDNLSQYENAMRLYDEGHRFAYLARFGNGSFDTGRYQNSIDKIIDTFQSPVPGSAVGAGSDDRLPILIVGMIRSGTTLTEQILSSHPDVGAAGEHQFWQRNAGDVDRLVELQADPRRISELGEQYIAALSKVSPETRRVTDKFPGNYLRVGMIRSALPNAKIVHCRRTPIDNSLSIYMTPNRASPTFSHSKEAIVFAYRQYERLMEHWRSVLPTENYFELQYDELVENPEPTIRRLLTFCELEWSDQCLSPELNPKAVMTPSLWQVRQPIYKTSVNRWRRYEPWLGAFKELL